MQGALGRIGYIARFEGRRAGIFFSFFIIFGAGEGLIIGFVNACPLGLLGPLPPSCHWSEHSRCPNRLAEGSLPFCQEEESQKVYFKAILYQPTPFLEDKHRAKSNNEENHHDRETT